MKPIDSAILELKEIAIEKPKNPLEMAQRIAKENYQDDEVDLLLEKHLAPNTLPIPSRLSRAENQKDFKDFLTGYVASAGENEFQQMAMSVELKNGRRAALITDGKQVMWSDPMGIDSIPDHIRESLQEALKINPDQIVITKSKLQHSTADNYGSRKQSNNHSAAFSIYLLSALSKGELFLNPNDNKLFGINPQDNSLANLEELSDKNSQKLGRKLRNEHLADLKEQYPEEAEKISQFKAEKPVKTQNPSYTIPSFGKILSNIVPLAIGFLAMIARPVSGQAARPPSQYPTFAPNFTPSSQPSGQPSSYPTQPSSQPSRQPTGQPSLQPSGQPSGQPSQNFTQPTSQPSFRPTGMPTSAPSNATAIKSTTIPNEAFAVGGSAVVAGAEAGFLGVTGEVALTTFEGLVGMTTPLGVSVFSAGSTLILGGALGGAVGAAVGASIGAAIDYQQSSKSGGSNNAEQNQNTTSSNSTASYSARKLSNSVELKTKTEANTDDDQQERSNTNQGAYLGGLAGGTLALGLFTAAIVKRRARNINGVRRVGNYENYENYNGL